MPIRSPDRPGQLPGQALLAGSCSTPSCVRPEGSTLVAGPARSGQTPKRLRYWLVGASTSAPDSPHSSRAQTCLPGTAVGFQVRFLATAAWKTPLNGTSQTAQVSAMT